MKMENVPERCIACGTADPIPCVWNRLEVLVCRACGLAWRASFDVPAEYYVELHRGEEGSSEGKHASRLRNAKDRLTMIKQFLPSGNICDIGCGDGSFLSVLHNAGYSGCWGIEPGVRNCETAKAEGLDVVQGTIERLDTLRAGRSYTATTLFHVIEHLHDPIGALKRILMDLPAGGVLVIETPDSEASVQRATGHAHPLVYAEHLFYWNKRALHLLMKQLGLEINIMKRRSFDWWHAPISMSLSRLGLLHVREQSGGSVFFDSPESVPARMKSRHSFIRTLVRCMLAYIVHILRKDDYLLLVARKTH